MLVATKLLFITTCHPKPIDKWKWPTTCSLPYWELWWVRA